MVNVNIQYASIVRYQLFEMVSCQHEQAMDNPNGVFKGTCTLCLPLDVNNLIILVLLSTRLLTHRTHVGRNYLLKMNVE